MFCEARLLKRICKSASTLVINNTSVVLFNVKISLGRLIGDDDGRNIA